MESNLFDDYIVEVDSDWNVDYMINEVNANDITELLDKLIDRIDCTKVYPSGLRVMQTIGYPYKREITSYIYVVTKEGNEQEDTDFIKYWINKLIERHQANLEYEKENPPVWYDGKPKKNNKRKPKAKEGDMFPEETKKVKISKAEAKLKAKLLGANLGFGGFKFKKD